MARLGLEHMIPPPPPIPDQPPPPVRDHLAVRKENQHARVNQVWAELKLLSNRLQWVASLEHASVNTLAVSMQVETSLLSVNSCGKHSLYHRHDQVNSMGSLTAWAPTVGPVACGDAIY
jgi:hypothetical protein